MEEKNIHIFQRAVESLLEAKAPQGIWEKIEEELEHSSTENKRESLKEAIDDLPNIKTPEFVWKNIDKELAGTNAPQGNLKYFKMAASIALLIGIGFLVQRMLQGRSDKELLSFSKEVIENKLPDRESKNKDSELDHIIQEQCAVQPDVCENPEFTELKRELNDLTWSLEQIKTQSENSDNDPETYKYILRIEKEKAEITKKIIQHFNS